jgi:glycosyltransferase involved in cell wall biosynthesis
MIQGKPEISIIIPLYNERENVLPIYERLKTEAEKLDKSYEIIFVNDGSIDGTEEELIKLKESDPSVQCILFRRNFQKAAAYSAGFKYARGDEGYDYVSGWKYRGKGNPYRAWPSKIFNIVVQRANKLGIHDFNCPFKAFKRTVIDPDEVYGELYRFLPVIAKKKGFRIGEVKIENLPRIHGSSKYGLERFLRGFFDFLTMFFLTRFDKRPLHFFGTLGLILLFLGSTSIFLLYTLKLVFGVLIQNTPFLFGLSVMSIILGMQFFSIGLVSELMINLNKKSDDHYVIKKIL